MIKTNTILILFSEKANMEISAAWLLTIFLAVAIMIDASPTSTTEVVRSGVVANATVESAKTTFKTNFIDYTKPFTDIKDVLMEQIQTLNKDTSDAKVNFLLYEEYCIILNIFLIL